MSEEIYDSKIYDVIFVGGPIHGERRTIDNCSKYKVEILPKHEIEMNSEKSEPIAFSAEVSIYTKRLFRRSNYSVFTVMALQELSYSEAFEKCMELLS